MAKLLQKFKKIDRTMVQSTEILDAEEPQKNNIDLIVSNPSKLGIETVKLLDQLEKAGFGAIAGRLRELQVAEGLEALDPYCARLKAVEKQIDDMLALGCPLDPVELGKLLKVAIDAYNARAKALLLPYGSISPRSAMQNRNTAPNVNLAIGIGNGISPRPK